MPSVTEELWLIATKGNKQKHEINTLDFQIPIKKTKQELSLDVTKALEYHVSDKGTRDRL